MRMRAAGLAYCTHIWIFLFQGQLKVKEGKEKVWEGGNP